MESQSSEHPSNEKKPRPHRLLSAMTRQDDANWTRLFDFVTSEATPSKHPGDPGAVRMLRNYIEAKAPLSSIKCFNTSKSCRLASPPKLRDKSPRLTIMTPSHTHTLTATGSLSWHQSEKKS